MTRSSRYLLLSHLAVAGLLAALLTHLIASYWAFWRMGTAGGNGLALMYVVAPVSTLALGATAILSAWYATRRALPLGRALAVALASMVAVAVLLFLVEVWRTSGYPTESGEAPAMLPFLSAHFGG